MNSKTCHSIIPVLLICLCIPGAGLSQTPENNETFWKLKSFRHGKSFFKKFEFEETMPLKEGEWDFQHYHKYDEIVRWFER